MYCEGGSKTNEKVTVTLIGTDLAEVGGEFVFNGPAIECENCKLKNPCLGLDLKRAYKIVGLRSGSKHSCPIHDSGVVAVEVVELPVIAAVESRKAFSGSKLVFEPIECENTSCSLYKFCNPSSLKTGDRCTISKVTEDLHEKCLKGLSLKTVELKRVD